MKIPIFDLTRRYKKYKKLIDAQVQRVLSSGRFILGPEGESFEKEFASFLNIKHVIGVNSGTDALVFALKALNIGKDDEVITVANTFVATVGAIRLSGAMPVLVDIDPVTNNIDPVKLEAKITKRTKAIIPVHLYGMPADMDNILRIAKKYKLKIIEDTAQGHGATYKGKQLGTIGDIGCFSFYPTKNLGAFGDAGAVVTNNKKFADKVRAFRNYGEVIKYKSETEGQNSRMDEMQAGLLRWSLTKLNTFNENREKLAILYTKELKGLPIELPVSNLKDGKRVWYLYVIKTDQRDKLKKYLEVQGVQTAIHYPISINNMKAYGFLKVSDSDLPVTAMVTKQILSLPLFPELTEDEVREVCRHIRAFYKK